MKFAEVLSNPDYSTPKALTSNAPLQPKLSAEDCLSPLVETKEYFEQTAKIPSHIVGLLLVRRSTDPNVIHQMRQLTNTTILKVEPKEGDENDVTVTDIVDVPEEKHPASLTGKFNPRGYEIFSIRGQTEADVSLASSCLSRIVEGEKIFFVMSELKETKGNQYRGDDSAFGFSGRGRGGRSARGRGFLRTSRGEPPFSKHSAKSIAETETSVASANEDGRSQMANDIEISSQKDQTEDEEATTGAVDSDEKGRADFNGRSDRRGRGRGSSSRGRVRYERGRGGRGAGRGRGRSWED